MEKVKLKITTITPVTIGSGVDLSPYVDYVIDDKKVCLIDKAKMVDKIMAKGDRILDDYVYGVANGIDQSKTRSNFDLIQFLTGNNITDYIDDIISSKSILVGEHSKKLPIKGLIKSPLGEPYFPGSTLKGAIKTVLMYNWLKTNKKGDKVIEEILENKKFDWLEKEFEYKEDVFTHEVIRENTIKQVTDSRRLDKSSTVVVDCYRKMPIRLECIAKNQISDFEIVLNNYKWKDLAKQANRYAEDAIEREFSLIENNDNLIKYYNYLAVIEDEIIDANENTAFFRIGFGKGYYLNSLGVAIYDYVSQEGKKVLKDKFEAFINNEFAKKDKYGRKQEIKLEEFPKTRLFVTNTKEPLGWIKVELSNSDVV